jgi:hypothetical protein
MTFNTFAMDEMSLLVEALKQQRLEKGKNG